MYLEAFILFVTLLCLADYLKKRRHYKCFEEAGFKGPLAFPLIGNAHVLLQESPKTVFDFQKRMFAKYGKTVRMWMLAENTLMTADAKMMEAVLSSQQVISKNNLYDLLHNWLGQGLLVSTGKKWFQRRRIITPTFHFKILDQFVEVFDQQSAIMAEQLYDRADGKTVINIFPISCLAALDIIAETAMGVKVHAQKNPEFPYPKSVTTVANIVAERLLNPIKRFDGTMKLFYPSEWRILNSNIDSMHDFTDKVIAERREALQKSIADGTYEEANAADDVGSKRRMALLDVLLQSTIDGVPLSNEDIREEVDTFMFEGHDTTTSGISHTLYLLARHPEIQEQCVREIREVIGDDKTKPVTMRDLNELKYLECVIKESMRMYPPVPMIGRHVTQDITLDGKFVPAGTNILIATYNAMRDPEYFPEPEKFMPERFSLDRKGDINAFVYTPFSAGPRNCIGQKFAMLELKSTVSKMLRHFELLPLGEPVQPLMNIILRSIAGVNVGLKKRVYA